MAALFSNRSLPVIAHLDNRQQGGILQSLEQIEERIVKRLYAATESAPHYWDFRENADDIASKKLFQYPAMMVPALQKQVIAAILNARPAVHTIADPFLGSGTILALAMLSGRSFIGQDINPLAILIAKTRAFSLDHESLKSALERVKTAAHADISKKYAVRFKRQAKWFTRGANIGLSRLRRAIRAEENLNTRRFLWVCLAETIRLNSNSRTSTYKLHIKPPDKRKATKDDIFTSFFEIADYNLQVIADFRNALKEADLLDGTNAYKNSVRISYGDTAVSFPVRDWQQNEKYQLLVTSPPYGDNQTTVPYGQAAWLPLQWIDFRDIDDHIPQNAASGYYDVDNRSLGGNRRRDLESRKHMVAAIGPRTKAYVKRLEKKSHDGISRFVHFVYDLRNAIKNAILHCCENGHIVFTLGNRNICGTVCPLTDTCAELLATHGSKEVIRITRQIPSKRMPGKNGHSATINHEYISIFQKGRLVSFNQLDECPR